jgi:iron complex outermembrane recepter protein
MRLAFLFVILGMRVGVTAQVCTHEVRGLVEASEGLPLPGATVWIEKLQTGTFIITGLCEGEHELLVQFLGYAGQRIKVRVPLQRPVVVTLRATSKVLHDVTVEGQHVQQHGLSQTVSILGEEELQAHKGKPLGQLLQQVSGVNVLMTGPAIFKPVIHGLHSQRILILNNGIRQEGQQWGVEHAPEIDPFIAAEIEVVKGAETVRYGADAIGGVILVNPPPLHQTSSIGGELNAGYMTNSRMGMLSGMLEGGFKNWTGWGWRLQGSGKKGGDFHAPNYTLSNTGTEELNFSATLGFSKPRQSFETYISSFNTQIGILRSAHTGNLTDLQNSIVSNRPWYVQDFSYAINNPRQVINHHLVKVKYDYALSDAARLRILYGGQLNHRKEFDVRRGGRSERPALFMELWSNVLDISYDHTRGKWSHTLGFNGTLKDNNNVPGTGIVPLIPNYQQVGAGAFVIEKIRHQKWLLEVGARFDHQFLEAATFDEQNVLRKPAFNFDYWSASIGGSYYFTDHSRFASHLGWAARPPHPSELFSEGLHHGTASVEYGLMRRSGILSTDSPVRYEQSRKWVNTFQYTNKRLALELSGYINSIDNYIFLRPTATRLTIRGYFPVFQFEQTNALISGGDLTVKYSLSPALNYTGKAVYLYATDLTNRDKLPFIPPTRFENALRYSRPTVGMFHDFYISVSVPTFLQQDRAPQTIYPADIGSETTYQTFDFMPAPRGYTLVNVEAGSKIPMANREIFIAITAENLLNQSYRNYMNRLRYYADDIGRNITLRVRYNFHAHD